MIRGRQALRSILPLLLILLPALAYAQTAAPESSGTMLDKVFGAHPDTVATGLDEPIVGVPLIVQADTVVTFRATLRGTPPTRRAEMALDRIERLRPSEMTQPVRIEPLQAGYAVLVGDMFTFLVLNDDVDPQSGRTTAQIAEAARESLGRALTERAELMSASRRWRSVIETIVGTIVAFVLILLLNRGGRIVLTWMQSKSDAHRGRLRFGSTDLIAKLSVALTWIAKFLTQIGSLVVVIAWVIYVLGRFPETQRWAVAAHSTLFDILSTFERGLLRAIPGLLAVALIIMVARFVSRIASDFFTSVERETIRLPAVHPETAGATRRLVNVLIWLFAIVVAYPLVPGSDSAAFQGISVFLGLIITLGSTGVVGHMMSGLVVVYSRALRPGDFVHVGEVEGVVTEVGALSVKVANFKKEEFTIPNTVIVGTTVKNYSRLSRGIGVALTTSVTIGYNQPWRVVHEMLITAAARTPGIRKEPAPLVLQTKLSDFGVEYQLVVRIEQPELRLATLNLLHQNIQDVFNERGVQIMTPAFESQPEQPVLVPKAKWSMAPGDRPEA